MKILILLIMIFLHIRDDFYQGILADLKQKKWWKDNYPEKIYKNDFIIALFMHSFSWSFFIHIPILILSLINNEINTYIQIITFSILINAIIHAIIDDLKANKFYINLIEDQLAHLIQIFIIWYIFT